MATAVCWRHGSRTQGEIVSETHLRLHVKCPLFLSDFSQNWILWINFSKNPQYILSQNPSNESRGVSSRWTDVQTETTKPIGVLRSFWERTHLTNVHVEQAASKQNGSPVFRTRSLPPSSGNDVTVGLNYMLLVAWEGISTLYVGSCKFGNKCRK
jgi:hypothetical protein